MLARQPLLASAGAHVAQMRHQPGAAVSGAVQQDQLGRDGRAVHPGDLDLGARRQRVAVARERPGEIAVLRLPRMRGKNRVDEAAADAVVRGEREGGLGGGAGVEDVTGTIDGEDHVGRGQHRCDKRRIFASHDARVPIRRQLAQGEDAGTVARAWQRKRGILREERRAVLAPKHLALERNRGGTLRRIEQSALRLRQRCSVGSGVMHQVVHVATDDLQSFAETEEAQCGLVEEQATSPVIGQVDAVAHRIEKGPIPLGRCRFAVQIVSPAVDHGCSISCFTREASASMANGLVNTCMPGARWPWLRTAFSA